MAAALTLGVLGRARKPDEHRLALHPEHLARIEPELRGRILLEEGYGQRFGASDAELAEQVAGVVAREELLARSDVVILPKPDAADLLELRPGQVLWGWAHAVQDVELTQAAIDRQVTVIAWEAMHQWGSGGGFERHVFAANNELAGYCSVLHALLLTGRTGAYGRPLRAAVISYGSTGNGAVRALAAQGVADITLLTRRESTLVDTPPVTVTHRVFAPDPDHPGRVVVVDPVAGRPGRPMAELLAEHDVVVNCVLQDTDNPLMFVDGDELSALAPGTLVVDVSIDPGMAFSWSRPTSFAEPLITVGDRVGYYAVDHSPSLLWDSATWDISLALLGHLPTVMAGPEAWEADLTISRAIELRDGVVVNPAILRFQRREEAPPHARDV